jgi:hypothetical protein
MPLTTPESDAAEPELPPFVPVGMLMATGLDETFLR